MRTMQFQGRHFAPHNVLRSNQIRDLQEEYKRCEKNIENAKFMPGIDIKGNMARMRAIEDQLAKYTAKPFTNPQEKDDAVREEKKIRQELIESMLSDKEMRHAPQRSAERHIHWERVNKPKVLYWKGLRQRLHASGVDFSVSEENVSNLELYRPLQKIGSDPNFDTSVIPVKEFHKVSDKYPEGGDPEKGESEPLVKVDIPEGTDENPLILEKRFMSLKKQVKDLTGNVGLNKEECLRILDEAGIVYEEN